MLTFNACTKLALCEQIAPTFCLAHDESCFLASEWCQYFNIGTILFVFAFGKKVGKFDCVIYRSQYF